MFLDPRMNSSLGIVFEVDPRDPLSRIGRRQSDGQGIAGSEREKRTQEKLESNFDCKPLDFVL